MLPYSWLRGDERLDRPFLPEHLGEDDPGVTAAIFVQADVDQGHSLREARWVDSLRAAWPQLAGIVAHVPVERADDRGRVLDSLAELTTVVGVRRLLQSSPDDFLRGDPLAAGLAELARRDLPFDACVRHPQLDALHDMIAKTPTVAIALDHLGKPPLAFGLDSEPGRDWLRNIERIARWPQVTIKLSGLPAESLRGRPVAEQALPFLRAALNVFGSSRSMIGSDWPVSAVTDHAMSRSAWFSLVLDGLGLSPAEREAVSWTTAARFYGLPTQTIEESRDAGAERDLQR